MENKKCYLSKTFVTFTLLVLILFQEKQQLMCFLIRYRQTMSSPIIKYTGDILSKVVSISGLVEQIKGSLAIFCYCFGY